MARIVSFVVLVAIILVFAGLFFQVMADFLLPMFLALMLVIMFGPMHRWFKAKCKGHDHIAAGLTTLSILLIVLVPICLIFTQATFEGFAIYDTFVQGVRQSQNTKDRPKLSNTIKKPANRRRFKNGLPSGLSCLAKSNRTWN